MRLQPELAALETFVGRALPKVIQTRMKEGNAHVTQAELSTVTRWKLTRGKFRPLLQKYSDSLVNAAVVNASSAAFKHAAAGRVYDALHTLSAPLKGVGPATASAVLAAAYPGVVPFMSDEALALVVPRGAKPKYSIAEGVELAQVLVRVAETLNSLHVSHHSWTAQDVQQAIWASAHLALTAGTESLVDVCKRLATATAKVLPAPTLESLIGGSGTDSFAGDASAETVSERRGSALGKRRRA
jgi:hypothetical protein